MIARPTPENGGRAGTPQGNPSAKSGPHKIVFFAKYGPESARNLKIYLLLRPCSRKIGFGATARWAPQHRRSNTSSNAERLSLLKNFPDVVEHDVAV